MTAEAENDFNFINLADYRVENSRFDVGGKRDAQGVYDAFLYGDRNIYRPGEKIIASGIVRNLNEALPAGMPVRVKISNPRGTVVSEQQYALTDEGSFETSYQTQPTASTGEYRIELYTGNNTFLSSYKVSVEDFVPDRLRLTLSASQETCAPGRDDQVRPPRAQLLRASRGGEELGIRRVVRRHPVRLEALPGVPVLRRRGEELLRQSRCLHRKDRRAGEGGD